MWYTTNRACVARASFPFTIVLPSLCRLGERDRWCSPPIDLSHALQAGITSRDRLPTFTTVNSASGTRWQVEMLKATPDNFARLYQKEWNFNAAENGPYNWLSYGSVIMGRDGACSVNLLTSLLTVGAAPSFGDTLRAL